MNSDKSLIDSLLKLDVSGSRSGGNEPSNRDDSRETEFAEDVSRFRRVSDPLNPPAGDSMKFSIMAPGVDGSKVEGNYARSPPRYNGTPSDGPGDYAPDAFAMGAVARFREIDDPKGIGAYPSIGGESVFEDRVGHVGRSQTQSRDGSGEASPFNREYGAYDSRSRSRSSSNPATRDLYAQPPPPPSDTAVQVGGPSGPMARTQGDGPYLSQHGYTAPNGAIAQQGTAYRPPADFTQPPAQVQPMRTSPAAAQPRPQGSYQIYPPGPDPQLQPPAQQYPRGSVPPHAMGVGAHPHADTYYGAPAAVDPYNAYKNTPYAKPYAQPYRGAPMPYMPTLHDPYGGGYPAAPQVPPMAGYPAPRYGKPASPAQYRQPYGRDDPGAFYAGGGYPGAPQPAYGYTAAGPYGAPPPMEDPYYGGAAAVNRVLGRPGGPDGYRGSPRGGGGGGGAGGYSNPVNVRLRDRALPVAEPVNLDTIDPNTVVYQVQFKKTIRNYVVRPGDMTPVKTGDFVVVQADRGEDLGVVTDSFTLPIFLEKRYSMRAYMDEEDQNVSYILRLASPTELKLLPEKFQDEEMIFKTCENLALHTYRLPMSVVDVEYQFDRHKITIFYDSPVRVDFRELVRDLFSSFKARIWMKKINQFHQPDIKHYAAMALATGVQFAPSND